MSLCSRRQFTVLAASALAAGRAAAQEFDRPPRPGAPRPLRIAVPGEQRLGNGMRLIVAQRPGVQLVTAELLLLSGSEGDPAEKAGLASMTAEMLTRGTRRRSATALAQAAETLGGALDSGAGWHESSVGITVAVPQLDAALALVAEVVQQPAYAQDELDRLLAQTLDELKVSYSSPGTLARLASQRLLFGAGPYGHPAGGTPQSLRRIARADLRALHATLYRPDNAVLILAGDLDMPTAQGLADRHFGRWVAPTRRDPVEGLPPNAELPAPAVVIDMPDAGQAAVIVATVLPPPGKDRATAVLANAVLGGGFSSRLNQEIRIRRGLSYSAGSGLDLRPGGGSLRAVVQTKNESAAEVVALVQAEMARLAQAEVPAEELEARKATLIGDVSRSVETTAGLAGAVSALVVDGRPLADLQDRIGAISAVTPQDVQRYARSSFGVARQRVAVAGDAAKFAAALPDATVIPVARLDLDGGERLSSP